MRHIAFQRNSQRLGCYFMLTSNPDHLNQIRCHTNTSMFLETSVFCQSALVIPHRKGGSILFMFLKSYMLLWTWQQCSLRVKNRAGISVWYETFPGIDSANCSKARWIVVKAKGMCTSYEGKVGEFER
jgi:hypothetical protein